MGPLRRSGKKAHATIDFRFARSLCLRGSIYDVQFCHIGNFPGAPFLFWNCSIYLYSSFSGFCCVIFYARPPQSTLHQPPAFQVDIFNASCVKSLLLYFAIFCPIILKGIDILNHFYFESNWVSSVSAYYALGLTQIQSYWYLSIYKERESCLVCRSVVPADCSAVWRPI